MKSGKGNKQNELLDTLRSELEQKKKENLELSISLQSLQSHNATLVQENMKLAQESKDIKSEAEALIDNQKFHISILEDRNKQILLQKREIQIKHDTLRITHDALCREFSEFKVEKDLEVEALRKKNEDDLQSFQATQAKFNNAIYEYERLVKEIGELKSIKESQQESFKVKMANIQREKIQSIDSIKKQMLNKACQMRNKALEIRKEQLQVTTRLTFLQNDQLIRELEFQSAKTEEILRRNSLLENEVKQLKRTVEIHQEVENELMKRNVGAKNIIANLTEKIKAATQQKQTKMKPLEVQPQEIMKPQCTSQGLKKEGKQIKSVEEKTQKNQQKAIRQQEDMQILKQYSKNMQKIHEDQLNQIKILKASGEEMKNQIKSLQTKINSQNFDNVGILMNRFLQQVIRPLKNTQEQRALLQGFDLRALKQVNVEKWSTENLQKITKIILNQLRPHLSLKLLKMSYFEATTENKAQNLDYPTLKQNLCVSKYLEALKRQKDKSIENIKSRSVTYIVEDRKQKTSYHHGKVSTIRNMGKGLLEPVAKRFGKPCLVNRA